jgi:hypothetical protein
MSERDTHFVGFAKLLQPELDRLYITLYARISELRPIEEIDKIEDEIRTLIAQRAYDLVYSLVERSYQHRGTFKGEIQEAIKMLPDMTAWPAHKDRSNGEEQ